MPHPDSDPQQNLTRRIAKWKAGLADLGRRNPLIKFRQDSPRSLEILTPQAEVLFQHLTKEKKVLHLKPDTDVRPAQGSASLSIVPSTRRDNTATVSNPAELKTRQTGAEQLKRLKRLRGEARLSLEERGINSLFIAFGTLTWYDNDRPGEALISPLILVPVSLIKERGRDIYKISILEEDIVLNPTLALKLKQTFGIILPEGDLLQEITYGTLIAKIRTMLVDREAWQIQENVFLSLFSYAKAAMIRDIIENEARICNHPILQAISGDIRSYQAGYKEPMAASALDVRVKPDRTFQILDADSSQQVVIEATKASSSFVVQGPPGTGKSQTIVNMIAELVGNGKSVLLVAEKDTALRVVYQRMVECGLNHLCLNLHHSGTTDKRKLVEDLSKTIKYIDGTGSSNRNNYENFFGQLVSSRQSIASYLESLYTKEQPLNKSPFELFGELLKKKREEVPDINIILSNFNQWSPSRLQEANNLLNQLANFTHFLYGEKTTIWSKTAISAYSYELELELREKIEKFQKAITLTETVSQQLQSIIRVESLSNLQALDTSYTALAYIATAPANLPNSSIGVDVVTASNAFATLRLDIGEIERRQPSQEVSNLLNQLSSFLPFLRGETATIWSKSKLQCCSESLELDLHRKIESFQKTIFLTQSASQRLQVILGVEPLLNLKKIENLVPILEYILDAPSNLPDCWSEFNTSNAQAVFARLNQDISFLESNEIFLKQKYSSKLFSADLPALNNRFQRYHRLWFVRIFNPNYRRDVKHLKELCIQNKKITNSELKHDLAQAVQVQTKRNDLYQNNYPARQVFGSLFNPAFSTKSELGQIKETLSWVSSLEQYSISTTSIQNILSSISLQRELIELVQSLKSFSTNFRHGIDFILLYFSEKDISKQNLPFDQILFTDLTIFLNLAITDLPKFRKWLVFKGIYEQLEPFGVQDFINALRENRPNPVAILRNKLSHPNYLPSQVFGSLFNPNIFRQSELQPIEESLNWLINLQQYSLPADSVQQILNSPSHRRNLAILVQQLELSRNQITQGLDFLLSYFNKNDLTDCRLPSNQIHFTDLKNFLSLAQSDLPYFQDWLTYKETYERLKNLGAENFLNALRSNRIESQLWFPVLEKIIYQTYLDAILTRRPELRNFNFEVHERQIRDFSRLDHNQLDVARERLKQIHTERWQSWQRTPVAQAELLRLTREANRQRGHSPIRRLLSDTTKGAPNLVKALKPCWMMSPLSVSQYIDPAVIHFDVVIFDEASQLRTEDVVSSIIRSDRVVVIGDRKQLPPTSFFSTGDSEEDPDEDDASYESILDECSNFMFGHTLKWHYRSQDERLIAFSNLHFYESQLVTFPNPVQNPELGVFFKHVPDGIYDRGGRTDNRIEAMTVAQLTLEHIQRVPNQSLGIVAFSEAQANAIQEQIEILSKDYPELEEFCSDSSTQFFLKALENVQGDERDVILLSIGYARDAQGRLSLNFGPLNKRGGERRLNVAVTRAKNKITLVSSILASDIDLTRTSSEGVRLLHNYLEYAASGGKRLQGNSYTDNLHFDSPFEEDVYHALRHHPSLQQYILRTQVGCSGYRIDLAIAHNNRPGEFLLGIECDGASYHRSPTARDRDRLRQQILEKLGWKIHRIWSTEWFRNKPEQVRFLVERIKQLQQ